MLVSLANAKDVVAGRLVCQFRNKAGAWNKFTAARFVPEVWLTAGEAPSYGFVTMPMNGFGPGQLDEVAPTCALQTQGPAGRIKLRTRAQISYLENNNAAVLMNGWVVSHTHQIDDDSIVSQIYDDRWVLSKYTVAGRMTYDPTTGRHYWDWVPTIFNDLGFPNCIDTPFGPRFAPCHRFGFTNNMLESQATVETYDEPEPGEATTRARSWRCQDIFRYYRDVYAPSSGGVRPPFKVYQGIHDLPDDIIFPEEFGGGIGSDRTPKNFYVHNMTLLHAMQATARKAGAYDIYCSPDTEDKFKSVLQLLDMNPKNFTGCTLHTAAYAASNIGQAMNGATIVRGGSVTESIVDYFDEVVICGDAPAVERMCSTYSSGVGANYLEFAWSAADEAAFKTYIGRYGMADTKGDLDSFQAASRIWPLVYAAYSVRIDADIWEGTKWAGMKNDGRPRMKVAQLTGYAQDATNPRNWSPREIVVEYLKIYADENTDDPSPEDPEWFEASRFDNLTLSSDSTIVMLSALREPGPNNTWYVDQAGAGQFDYTKMHARHIRIQLALEADWPLTGVKGNGGQAADDPNRASARIAEGPRWSFVVAAEEMDYDEYLRSDQSRPVGAALIDKLNDGTTQAAFGPRQTEGNELFTDRVNKMTGRLPRHADARNRDVKRVAINATLNIEPISIGMRPGLGASVEAGDSIPIMGVVKGVHFRAEAVGQEGQTTVILAPADSGAIYDPPSTARGSAGYNIGTTTQTKKKQDDVYDSGGGGSGSGSGGSGRGGSYNNPAPADYGSPSPSRAASPRVASDNDTDANNKAIRNNPTANQNMSQGTGGQMASASSSDARSGGDTSPIVGLFGGSGGDVQARGGGGKSRGVIRGADQIASDDALTSEVGNSQKGIFTGEALKQRDDDRRIQNQEVYRNSGNKDTPMARGLAAGERSAANSSKYNIMGEMGPIVGRAAKPGGNVGGVSLTPSARASSAVAGAAAKKSTATLSNLVSGNYARPARRRVEPVEDE
jgi:hypothetical protein